MLGFALSVKSHFNAKANPESKLHTVDNLFSTLDSKEDAGALLETISKDLSENQLESLSTLQGFISNFLAAHKKYLSRSEKTVSGKVQYKEGCTE